MCGIRMGTSSGSAVASAESAAVEFRDAMVAVPGGEIFVRLWNAGRDNLAPIVLLHDSLGSVEQWREFPAALAQAVGRPVLAYDRLGFGRSSPRTQPAYANFIAEEAEVFFPAVAHALGLSDFVLFGHSVGGAMAIVVAALHADRCKAVVTESAQAFVEARTLDGIRAAKESFEDPERFARIAKWHGAKARWVLDAWTEVWLSPEFRSWTLDPHLQRVRCPVLAIHGDSDEYGSEAFPRRIAANVGGPSELRLLADCGHVPHREKPDEVLGLTASFISRYCP